MTSIIDEIKKRITNHEYNDVLNYLSNICEYGIDSKTKIQLTEFLSSLVNENDVNIYIFLSKCFHILKDKKLELMYFREYVETNQSNWNDKLEYANQCFNYGFYEHAEVYYTKLIREITNARLSMEEKKMYLKMFYDRKAKCQQSIKEYVNAAASIIVANQMKQEERRETRHLYKSLRKAYDQLGKK